MIRTVLLPNVSLWGCLWQSTVFAVLGLAGSFLLRRRPARAHQMLLLAVLAAVLVPALSGMVRHFRLGLLPPSITVPERVEPQEPEVIEAGAPTTTSATEVAPAPRAPSPTVPPDHVSSGAAPVTWRTITLGSWVAASSALLGRLLFAFAVGTRLSRRARPLSSGPVVQAVRLAQARLGVTRELLVRIDTGVHSPVIWCWGRRLVLLLPDDGSSSKGGIDWTGVISHELAHWKRRDHVSGLLGELAVCVLPWNPFLWLSKRHLVSLAEQACDDWVVASGQPVEDYAESLLDFKPRSRMAFVPAVVHSREGVATRVRRILNDACGNPRTGTKWALGVTTLVACVAVGFAFAQTRSAEPVALVLEFPKIDRRPAVPNYRWDTPAALAHYDPNSTNPFQVDLRSRDLTGLDLTGRVEDLLHATFDDRTKWPAQIPPGYDYERIMELGKNPGLGIRDLHRQGITGRGVGIAICDQPLLVDHQEYRDRLRLYEEIDVPPMQAQMHGPGVASIAVGKTVGVAPEADLYFIGKWSADSTGTRNFESTARGVRRILEINEQLPAARKIRVISLSVGWSPSEKGYQQITDAVNKAKAAGMLVISSSVEEVHGFAFHGLGRSPLAHPDDVNSYEPGAFWARGFYQGKSFADSLNRLLVPMDARTLASPTAASEYVFYAQGGWSWSIPYIAGVYALAAQVEPKITPDRFWALALRTGRTIDLQRGGKTYKLGRILNPAGLMAAFRQGELADGEAVAAELAKYYPAGTRQPR
jgi:beta-lactamase regulating signal transducer with metallopeptidase domain